MEIPIIEKLEIKTIQYDELLKEWDIHFYLKRDKTPYRTSVYIDENIGYGKLSWFHGRVLSEYSSGLNRYWTAKIKTDIWEDQIFEQVIYYIQKYSKERIRLIQYQDIMKTYRDLSFKPQNYPYEASIKVV